MNKRQLLASVLVLMVASSLALTGCKKSTPVSEAPEGEMPAAMEQAGEAAGAAAETAAQTAGEAAEAAGEAAGEAAEAAGAAAGEAAEAAKAAVSADHAAEEHAEGAH